MTKCCTTDKLTFEKLRCSKQQEYVQIHIYVNNIKYYIVLTFI